MIGIVKLALKRPNTFIVMSLIITLFGVISAFKTPVDIFPQINIPVISAVWTYSGMPPEDMAGRIVYYYERSLSSTVNDIEHIESQSLFGYGIVKIFFQPDVDIRTANAQVTAISQTVLKMMPPGITPPLILNYNAATVPILQLALSSKVLSEDRIFDLGQNFIRPQLATVRGSAVPSPYGGKVRQIQIDLNPQAMQSKGISPDDVANALKNQNLILSAGTEKIGTFEYNIKINDSPEAFEQLNDLPIKKINGVIIFIRDVAHVRDGYPPQINVVRNDGRRSVLMTILKNGATSTLDIIQGTKDIIPKLEETLPKSLHIDLVGDQSIFVKAALAGVVREGMIAIVLTSIMILLFLGSWRSTIIISLSIPLSLLSAVILLSITGNSLNVMTLGGLALAVGMLVDNATVVIENINYHLEQGKEVTVAIIDAAKQIIQPAFVSTLCFCIVFVPMFSLTGVPRYLFVPMAEAVVFGMLASFILSQTFVPMMANKFLKAHQPHDHNKEELTEAGVKRSSLASLIHFFISFQHQFEKQFAAFRNGYRSFLIMVLANPKKFTWGFTLFVLVSCAGLYPMLGRNFFPTVDSGDMKIHVRAQVGTRIEETAKLFDLVEGDIRRHIPTNQLDTIVDNIGLSVSGINTSYSNTGTIGPQDGDILIHLNENHSSTSAYVKQLREFLPRDFPGVSFAFLPADITSQILNFGAPAPIDIQVNGPNKYENLAFIKKIEKATREVPGIADVRLQQATNYPQFNVDIDRVQANSYGLTEADVTNSLVATLAGTSQVAPTFWLNPSNGVSYPIVIQMPQYRINSLADLENIPITAPKSKGLQVLGGLGSITRTQSDSVISHYNIKPAFDIYASTQGRDLGSVSADIQKIIDKNKKDLPRGAIIELRGQVPIMENSYMGLSLGLIASIVLIYFLIVINFESWLDPFVIITALPAALAGIVWMLFTTYTTLSVPALTGAIMCMGVATANSILVVSFARERLQELKHPVQAALEAGVTRFRPVLMTAAAMVIGMIPMALGLGDGGEQNAPLGRAVIGGLLFATFATLLFVPAVFSLVHRNDRFDEVEQSWDDESHDPV
ncbi:efflux RND transporter permease subunit [Ferrovum sp. PN-J185]|uniref:efflux RND transporter permease subunit n=1 Tax=Ferrovum sp. PN-J185 TaxID=1356306 RepID=UPI0007960613|nr:efflux RND transporter permease subunit [Ferrovum sp. PN-J185]KXW56130.1 multidrug resistance protein MdtC [Ferrovum sp. PN-J185]MCC6067808.1 efflux RND transporter permease subunit [Ferrovum sp. PN-J185]